MCSIIIVQKSCLCQVLQRQAQAQALMLNACRALTVAPDGLQAQKRFGRNELVADEGQPLKMPIVLVHTTSERGASTLPHI